MIEVRIEQLSKRFGQVVALDNVSVTIPAGELFFMLGPSGCGKTTLLRSIAGFCQSDTGRIRFGDQDITDTPAHRRNTGMVFQNYALWPHMTAAQNVAFGLEVRRIPRDQRRRRVAQALDVVQMTALADRKPNEMSGGQQQRVALARALVVEPACILLDEPLSNLDAKLRLEMRTEIRRICKQAHLTAIYVTHDQSEALSIADRIAVLRDGRLEQVGSPRQLYEQPANPFVASFIGETNFIPGTVTAADGTSVTVRTAIGDIRSRTEQRLAPGQAVICSVRPESVQLGQTPAGSVNTLTARVTNTVYLGQMARHDLTVGDMHLTACQLHPLAADQTGDQAIPVWIDPNDVVVLNKE